MKTLVMETSTEKASLLLTVDGISIAHLPMPGGPDLSKKIALEVSLLLEEHSFLPDRILVGQGPGSFTGIRVGTALAKALSFGWKIPLFGFCSLRAFAPPIAQPYAVLVDARMGGFYILRSEMTEAALFSPLQAEEALQKISFFASPHPALIQKRLSLPGTWIETSPDPSILARIASAEVLPPPRLSYLGAL